MPAYFLKMHLESLAHFDLSTHIAFHQSFISTDVQTKRLLTNHHSLCHKSTRLTKLSLRHNQWTQRSSTRSSSTRPVIQFVSNCWILYIMYSSPPPSHPSTHYIRIMTPFRFSIISCYQFALINTTFLLPLIIISTHQASSYGQRR